MNHPDFSRYTQAFRTLVETTVFDDPADPLIRLAAVKSLHKDMVELADEISEEGRSPNHTHALRKLNLAVTVFQEAALDAPGDPQKAADRIRSVFANLDKFVGNISR